PFLFPSLSLGSAFARRRGAAYGNVERMRTGGRRNRPCAAIEQPFSKTKPDSHLDLSLTPAVPHSAYNLDRASRSRRARLVAASHPGEN
ncbi:hypothetical protein ALC62_08192, partial [Cyphomyrmex costatus]